MKEEKESESDILGLQLKPVTQVQLSPLSYEERNLSDQDTKKNTMEYEFDSSSDHNRKEHRVSNSRSPRAASVMGRLQVNAFIDSLEMPSFFGSKALPIPQNW